MQRKKSQLTSQSIHTSGQAERPTAFGFSGGAFAKKKLEKVSVSIASDMFKRCTAVKLFTEGSLPPMEIILSY